MESTEKQLKMTVQELQEQKNAFVEKIQQMQTEMNARGVSFGDFTHLKFSRDQVQTQYNAIQQTNNELTERVKERQTQLSEI